MRRGVASVIVARHRCRLGHRLFREPLALFWGLAFPMVLPDGVFTDQTSTKQTPTRGSRGRRYLRWVRPAVKKAVTAAMSESSRSGRAAPNGAFQNASPGVGADTPT